jgi:uncharacterized membrane protein
MRANLDQTSLLAEHEITKLITLVSAYAAHLDVHTDADQAVHQLEKDVAPNAVLDQIEASETRVWGKG